MAKFGEITVHVKDMEQVKELIADLAARAERAERERDEARREGICGSEAPSFRVGCTSMPAICELRHGHASEWHEGEGRHRWRGPADRNEARLRAAEAELAALRKARNDVVDAARTWRQRVAGSILGSHERPLAVAVDVFEGAQPCICNPAHRPDDPICRYRAVDALPTTEETADGQ